VVRMGCSISITVRLVPEGRVSTGLSGGTEKKRGAWNSTTGKKTPKPKDRKSI
jgi:hypothetical protein